MYMRPPVAVSLPVPLMVSLPEDPLLFFSSPARPAPLSKVFSVPAPRVSDTFPELLSAIWNAGAPGVPVVPLVVYSPVWLRSIFTPARVRLALTPSSTKMESVVVWSTPSAMEMVSGVGEITENLPELSS